MSATYAPAVYGMVHSVCAGWHIIMARPSTPQHLEFGFAIATIPKCFALIGAGPTRALNHISDEPITHPACLPRYTSCMVGV